MIANLDDEDDCQMEIVRKIRLTSNDLACDGRRRSEGKTKDEFCLVREKM